MLSSCFRRGCQITPGCPYPSAFNKAIDSYDDLGSLVWNSLCPVVPSGLDSDIGRIGVSCGSHSMPKASAHCAKVYISYWIQASLAILGLIGITLFDFILPNVRSLRVFGMDRLPDCRKMAHKRLSRLVASIANFLKAQCFFLLVTNIAAIVVTKNGGSKPQSLQQIYNNYIFPKTIAVSGFLPVSFTLFLLHLAGVTSWYLISISCSSVFLSLATLNTLGAFRVAPNDHASLLQLATSGGP